MKVSPYLFFNGACRDALTFYSEIFGNEPLLMDASGMPPEFNIPEDRKSWIMHGQVQIGGDVLMASDSLMEPAPPMVGCSVQLNFDTAAEGKTIFDALADGGVVTMPWAPTFWSAGFGALTDKFGVRWMVGTFEEPS